MSAVARALAVETRKAAASTVVRAASVLVVVGVTVLVGSMTVAARAGNEQIIAQLGPAADASGWALLLGIAMQVSAAATVLGFGVTLSWIIGREFADGTVTSLFALPVSRAQIAGAKLVLFALWSVGIAVALTLALAAFGLAIGLGAPDQEAFAALGRHAVLVILSAGIATPAAWAATLGRGLLPGIAATIGVVVIAQVGAIAGLGPWLPLAAPALWAMQPAAVSPLQLLLSLAVPALFAVLALSSWRRLQLDR